MADLHAPGASPRAPGGGKDLLTLAQEAGRLGIFEWALPGGVVRLSARLLALYGITAFDGSFASWLDCVFREDRVRVSNLIETALAERATEINCDFRIRRSDDQTVRWIEARNTVVFGAGGQAERIVGVHVDVTEQKRAIVQLRAFTESLEERIRERTQELEAEFAARQKAEQSLRQSHKMEAVGQLTGGIAHDFNNLLTVVLGGLDVIGQQLPKLPDSPQTAAALARIHKGRNMAVQGVRRAAALIERLMAFSRLQPLAPTAVDANRLVAGTCELLRRTLGEQVALETVLAGGLWPAFVDANQLENAILNLALNARDAMPHGGKLTIETANCHLDEAYVSTVSEPVAAGQYVLLAVTDTGVGMTAATVDRAFEPFFTTKEAGKGTGLGLSQVYGFVRQSSGHIRVYSEPGEGTTIKIYLPRHAGGGDARQASAARPAASTPGASAECVLVVEDDATLRAHAVECLQGMGYSVLEADSGVAALAIVAGPQRIDLLFTDVVMPGGVNGRQLADLALRERPGLKVLFTTGYTRNAIVHHGRLDAGIHLITKPYSLDELAAKVRERLEA